MTARPVSPDDRDTASGRLSRLDGDSFTSEQAGFRHYLDGHALAWARHIGIQATDPQGRLIGPFNVFLRSPTISQAYNELIAVETAHTVIPPAIREIVILAVGVEWQSQYEIYAHTVAARACGVSEDVIDAILNRRRSISGTEIEGAAYTFTRELVTTKHIGEATYRKTSRALGIRGVVDLVHLIGIYLTTSALLNAFNVPAPDGVIEA